MCKQWMLRSVSWSRDEHNDIPPNWIGTSELCEYTCWNSLQFGEWCWISLKGCTDVVTLSNKLFERTVGWRQVITTWTMGTALSITKKQSRITKPKGKETDASATPIVGVKRGTYEGRGTVFLLNRCVTHEKLNLLTQQCGK